MKLLSPTLLSLLLIAGGTVPFAQGTHSKTFGETRRLLLEMERHPTNRAFKKLFEEGDIRQSDLIGALDDSEQKVSLNAQSIILYLADPQGLSALGNWYEYRRTHSKEYWISPVKFLDDVRFLNGNDRDLARLVLKNLHLQEKAWWAKLLASNKNKDTFLIEVVEGEIFTEGWHVTIRRENGKWRMLSNYLVWQS
jgi:hypothetical protein